MADLVNSVQLVVISGMFRPMHVTNNLVTKSSRGLVQCFFSRMADLSDSSEKLDSDLLSKLNPAGKKSGIYECDFFALLCSFLVWGDTIGGSAVFYTDNNAVRDSLIACHTINTVARRMLVAVLSLECTKQIAPWGMGVAYAP